jgi:hypothetical protein
MTNARSPARLAVGCTHDELAAAAGLRRRQLQRWFAKGLPRPVAGEQLRTWSAAARAWIAAHRRKPGPRRRAELELEQAARQVEAILARARRITSTSADDRVERADHHQPTGDAGAGALSSADVAT